MISIASSSNQETMKKPMNFTKDERIAPPVGFTVFPAEFSKPPRSWLERVYNVQYWSEAGAGGHFAAMEQPEIMAKEIRQFFSGF